VTLTRGIPCICVGNATIIMKEIYYYSLHHETD